MQAYFEKARKNLELNDSFDEVIQTRHSAVRSAIENLNPSIKKTQLIGSLQRKTRTQPRVNDVFDIDILVELGEFTNWVTIGGISPANALATLHSSVKDSERYSTKDPQIDAPTITLSFAEKIKVELVPAYVDQIGYWPDGQTRTVKGRGYWVPKNGKWELADYNYEAEHISLMNTASDGHLVPSIKLFKAIKRNHFPVVGSFPIEILAAKIIPAIVQARKQQGLPITAPDLILTFFSLAGGYLQSPIQIPGSGSPAITLDPQITTALRDRFAAIVEHINGIDAFRAESERAEQWRVLLGEVFPLSV